jgi:hypothetical protein
LKEKEILEKLNASLQVIAKHRERFEILVLLKNLGKAVASTEIQKLLKISGVRLVQHIKEMKENNLLIEEKGFIFAPKKGSEMIPLYRLSKWGEWVIGRFLLPIFLKVEEWTIRRGISVADREWKLERRKEMGKVCSICGGPYYAKGLCKRHYQQSHHRDYKVKFRRKTRWKFK